MSNPTKILLKAKHSLNQGAAWLSPTRSPHGGYYGVERLSEEQKRTTPLDLIITPETMVKIKHLTEFNLQDEVQRKQWEFLQFDPRIAKDSKDAARKPYALFYVDDEEAEIENSLTVYREKLVLAQWIGALSTAMRVEVCSLMGYKTDGNNPVRVEEFLLKQAVGEGDGWRRVKEVKAWTETGYHRKIQFVKRLVEKRVLTQRGNMYTYGQAPVIQIGDSIEKVIYWLEQPENAEQVRNWHAQIRERVEYLQKPVENPLAIELEPNDRFENIEPNKRVVPFKGESVLENLLSDLQPNSIPAQTLNPVQTTQNTEVSIQMPYDPNPFPAPVEIPGLKKSGPGRPPKVKTIEEAPLETTEVFKAEDSGKGMNDFDIT